MIVSHLYILYVILNTQSQSDNTSLKQIWYLCYDVNYNKHYYSTLNNISNYVCNTTML